MFTSQSPQNMSIRRIATVLSLIAAVVYFIIALGFVPDDFKSPPVPLMFVAALAYLVGGLLILRVERRLLLVGAALNLIGLPAFSVSVITGNGTADALSLVGKLAQVGLELMLVWLVWFSKSTGVEQHAA